MAKAQLRALPHVLITLGMLGTAAPGKAQEAAAVDASLAKKPGSSWVKLCDKTKPDGTAKPRDVCIVHHERIDPETGAVVISVALRRIAGDEKQRFMVTVPLGMAVRPGMQARFDNGATVVKLNYAFCLPSGCTAEADATPELIQQLTAGGSFEVAAINALSDQIGFDVPLAGFQQTLDGPPVDAKVFRDRRNKMIAAIVKKHLAKLRAGDKAAPAE